ncbi:MAG: hypothetical protein ACKVPJ_05150 [Chitinophagales bacterium]
MKKKIFFIIAGVFLFIAIVYFFVLRPNKKTTPALFAVPSNAAFVIDIPDLHVFTETINKEAFVSLHSIQAISKCKEGTELLQKIASVQEDVKKDISENTISAGAVMITERELEYVFILELDEALDLDLKQAGVILKKDKPSIHTHEYQKEKIYEFTYSDTSLSFSAAKVFGLFIISTSTVLTENAVLNLKSGRSSTQEEAFVKTYNAIKTKASPSVFINTSEFAKYLASFVNERSTGIAKRIANFASWTAFTLDIHNDEILLQGFASPSENSMLANISSGLSKSTEAALRDCNKLIPENVATLTAITDENLFEYCSFRLKDTPNDLLFRQLQGNMKNVIVSGFSETIAGNFSEKIFLLIPVSDSAAVMQALSGITKPDTIEYKNYPVKKLLTPDVLNAISGFTQVKQYYYTCIENILLFCNSSSELQNNIETYCNRLQKIRQAKFEHFPENRAVRNFSFFLNLQKADQVLYSLTNEEGDKRVRKSGDLFEKFSPITLGFSKKGDLFTFNASVKISSLKDNPITPVWKTLLDAPLATEPIVVFNHLTKEKNIVIQDTLHQIYLVSTDGTITWKKQMLSKIQGAVFPVDFYGNNKTQLLLATRDNIQMLDLNGEIAEGFQIDFTSPAVNELSVFYNSTGSSYLFFIACENGNVYGFDKEGKPLPGWNPLQNKEVVTTKLSYASSVQEDFFVFVNKNLKMVIKSGAGETRRDSQQLTASVLDAFQQDKKKNPTSFVTVDSKGNLIQFRLSDGKIITFSLDENFLDGKINDMNNDSIADVVFITPRSITAKTLNGETLYSTTIPLGTTYKIQLCTVGEKNYTGLFSTPEKNIYLFDGFGNIFKGFPLQGDGPFKIDDLRGDGKNVLITSFENYLTAYLLK